MSVYIKGFPLPNNCGACPLRLAWCRERIYMVTRPERCPLVHVPPHGRLICDRDVKWAFDDAILDEAQKTGQVRATSDEVASVINAIPTIIPADKEGGE